MKMHNKKICGFLLAVCLLMWVRMSFLSVRAADRVQPVEDEIVIVIDPGHGGSNLGTQSGHTI